MRNIFLLFVLILFLSTEFYPQSVGKIIFSAEADSLFGLPVEAYKIDSSELSRYATQSTHLFFHIQNGNLLVLDKNKKILFPQNHLLNGTEVFHVFSADMIEDIISRGSDEVLFIEKRKEVLTITNNGYTMEYSFLCPPFCAYD
jgi:hypothetical protein